MTEELNINAQPEEIGEIVISEDVVLVIAGLAVSEVAGVAVVNSLTDGIVEKFVKKNYGKGIRVEITDKNVSVDVHVTVEYGVKIPDAAWELQETVKKNIETMTNLTVTKVNIFVEGISVEKELKPEAKDNRRTAKEEKKAAKAAKAAEDESDAGNDAPEDASAEGAAEQEKAEKADKKTEKKESKKENKKDKKSDDEAPEEQ